MKGFTVFAVEMRWPEPGRLLAQFECNGCGYVGGRSTDKASAVDAAMQHSATCQGVRP